MRISKIIMNILACIRTSDWFSVGSADGVFDFSFEKHISDFLL